MEIAYVIWIQICESASCVLERERRISLNQVGTFNIVPDKGTHSSDQHGCPGTAESEEAKWRVARFPGMDKLRRYDEISIL